MEQQNQPQQDQNLDRPISNEVKQGKSKKIKNALLVLAGVFLATAGIIVFVSWGASIDLFDTRSQLRDRLPQDLAACTSDNQCVVVPYKDCCASEMAINKYYEEAYLNHPKWQELPQEQMELCKVIECDDETRGLNSAECRNNVCTLVKAEDITIDWQTYRNDEFGFEFEYPGHFSAEEQSYTGRDMVFGVRLQDKMYKQQPPAHWPSMSAIVIETDLSPREWLEKYKEPRTLPPPGAVPEPAIGYEDLQEVTVAGMRAIRFREIAVSDSSVSTIIEGQEGNRLYYVQAISSGLGNFPRNVHDQILSTFRFVP